MEFTVFIAIGLVAGVCSGLFGIGGGIVIIPMLTFFAKFEQHKAVGTSLVALLLPVGALAVIEYYRAGKITSTDIVAGLMIAAGILCGAWLGARLGLGLSETMLRRAFAVFIMIVGIRLFIKA